MTVEQGRRERGKAQKQARIFDAARSLFDEYGYASVTTQQVAERADVAAGTVFRYAATKAELLLMVRNEEFRTAVQAGLAAASDIADPTAAVVAAIAPVLQAAVEHPADTAAYQRELMFGGAGDQHRTEGLSIVADLEDGIARLLAGDEPSPDADSAARAIFACTHLVLLHASNGGVLAASDLHTQIGQIVAGWDRHPRRVGTSARTHERAIPAGEKES